MSLIKAIKVQLGLSNTPANNFTLDASADNGTLKLARGNAGATTQDILTVDANGNVLVDGNNLNLFSAKSLASSGYQKLPSGLIIQWGSVLSANIATTTVNYPIAFPNNCFQVVASGYNVSGSVQAMVTVNSPSGLSSALFSAFYAGTPGVSMSLAGTSQVRIQYIAIGN